MNWNVAIITLCALLALLLLWKEAVRRNQSRLAARVIASLLAAASLACSALPVSVSRERVRPSSPPLILLTEGFTGDSVQALLNTNKNARVFTTDKNITAFHAVYTPGTGEFSAPSYSGNPLQIFGYGLAGAELDDLQNTPVIFHPGVVGNGITAVGWTQTIPLGQSLIVQGRITNGGPSPLKLVLSGFDTALDSVLVSTKSPSYFQLSAKPKHLGRAVYSITILSGKDTVEKDPLPVEVKSSQPLNVLLLAASPDFENKFLKSWLAQNGYKLAVRTLISKNKFDRQYSNTQPVPLDRITPSLLSPCDVVIADAAELAALSSPELAALRNAVEKEGTGLVVKADSAGASSAFYASSFPLVQLRDSIQHSLRLALGDAGHLLPPLKIEQPLYIRNETGTQALAKDQSLHTLAGSKLYGTGRVVLTTVPNTFSWKLSGNADAYASYWSWLLGKAAKRIPLQQASTVAPELPRADEEVHLSVQTQTEGAPQLQAGAEALYPQQHYRLPYEWAASYWPRRTGWQPLSVNGASTYWYVYSPADWPGVKATEKIAATKAYAGSHLRQPAADHFVTVTETVPVPKIYFLLLFLLSAGFLWAEKKFNGDEQR